MEERFVVTAWRDSDELLELRSWFYQSGKGDVEDQRQHAVDKVLAWRVRKPELPLLLDSTADIVDAVLQDERGQLGHNALRLVYATAIARFVTGFTDTQLDLRRSRPSWMPADPSKPFLPFPGTLLETRHNIVHRQLPPLAQLKKAAQQSLEWLWEWYWSQLDAAFSRTRAPEPDAPSIQHVKEQLQGTLKAYVRSRKAELKGGVKAARKESKAAETAANSISSLTSLDPAYRSPLLALLVDEQHIIPSDRKTGDSMSGAFLLWGPCLLQLSAQAPTFLHSLLDQMMGVRNGRAREPVKEAMLLWLVHILTSDEWDDVRTSRKLVEPVLEKCFVSPTHWNLQLAEALLQCEDVPHREQWHQLVSAAKDEDMELDLDETVSPKKVHDTAAKGIEGNSVQKSSGPQKWVGLWRPTPIGLLPGEWDGDE